VSHLPRSSVVTTCWREAARRSYLRASASYVPFLPPLRPRCSLFLLADHSCFEAVYGDVRRARMKQSGSLGLCGVCRREMKIGEPGDNPKKGSSSTFPPLFPLSNSLISFALQNSPSSAVLRDPRPVLLQPRSRCEAVLAATSSTNLLETALRTTTSSSSLLPIPVSKLRHLPTTERAVTAPAAPSPQARIRTEGASERSWVPAARSAAVRVGSAGPATKAESLMTSSSRS
jgi:hypothetical protein